ncbi:hypothetical protein HZY83_07200 [Gemella sp. GH3]|uniref:hypothetical protein n=1 Tax=unclassified Gemella TaxID=2624949 RepID=UPI0015CFEFDD|nr:MULTISPECIES: hypothetical protein [unclassified Gemella]MBF0714460.1 hypothetical protein [Gemella sp. GH3.1]NYS51412.1 hypothetical protein [Gemella sp. GH3]
MRNIKGLVIINILIVISLVILYLRLFSEFYLILIISILMSINIYWIYQKSNTFDENEIKKKIILHKIKNSLSVILGYSDAYNDNLITKQQLDEQLNQEIKNVIDIIKEETYNSKK